MAMVGVSSHYGRTCGPTQLTLFSVNGCLALF